MQSVVSIFIHTHYFLMHCTYRLQNIFPMLFSAKEELATYALALTKWLAVWKTRAKGYRGFGLAPAKNVARDLPPRSSLEADTST